MRWTDTGGDRWGGGSSGTLGLVVRLGGLAFLTVVLVRSGAFSGCNRAANRTYPGRTPSGVAPSAVSGTTGWGSAP